jgi:glyoxylase-like metal-dependent hydrolase (beta-lactamase superfamily II)
MVFAMLMAPASAQSSKVPAWDARGLTAMAWQGVACLDVSPDGRHVAVGTVAPSGDPNVLLLGPDGRLVRSWAAGQRWIQDVVVARDGRTVLALCTTPEGRADDGPAAFRCGEKVAKVGLTLGQQDYPWTLFFYGDHSNHCGTVLRQYSGGAVGVWRDNVCWLSADPSAPGPQAHVPLPEHAVTVALAAAPNGEVLLGCASQLGKTGKAQPNLFLLAPGEKAPRWGRAAKPRTADTPKPAPGDYGTPRGKDGVPHEVPQQDVEVRAPLSLAVHADASGAVRLVASADYVGWQRWLDDPTEIARRSVTRFLPTRPVVSVYASDGKLVREFAQDLFDRPLWLDLRFLPGARQIVAYPHHWTSRGLAAQPLLPADEDARALYLLDIASGRVQRIDLPDAVADAVPLGDAVAASCWNGRIYRLAPEHWQGGQLPAGIDVGSPCLLAAAPGSPRLAAASNAGVVRVFQKADQADQDLRELWRADLSAIAPHGEKPWMTNAVASKVVPGLWHLPGGRVESDGGAQYVIQAPKGLILIEAHSGLSFEREWAAMVNAGLDPRQVRYVLLTHEHGDHGPGAYLWRVATGAEVVCSGPEAYALQYRIPTDIGYGFHPPVPTDVRIKEDTDLDLAGLKVRAVRLPGHTPGSMGYAFETGGKRFIATGDLIMGRGVLGFFGSVGASAPDTLASLRKLQGMKADMILGGHGSGPPAEMVEPGIAVGRHVGWGLIPPEAPDPLFRISQKNVLVAAFACDAAAADFGDHDGDGRPDVAVVSPRGEGSVVRVFLNKGGKFDAMKADWEIALPTLAAPNKLRLCKLSGGRYPDVFMAGAGVAVLLSTGSPGKYEVHSNPGLGGPSPHQLRVADLAGTGRPQWMMCMRFGGVCSLALKNGSLVTGDPERRLSGPYIDFRETDLNGDGRGDLVSSYGGIWLRGVDGRLPDQPAQRLSSPAADEWCFMAVGDFNGDRKPDVAIVSNRSDGCRSARIFHNTRRSDRPFDEKPSATIEFDGRSPHVRDAPFVADWNGDGIDDLVIALGQDTKVRVYLGGPAGLDAKQVETIRLDYQLHYEHSVYVADFNGDGRADLAVFGYTNTGIGPYGPNAAYIWISSGGQPARPKNGKAEEK